MRISYALCWLILALGIAAGCPATTPYRKPASGARLDAPPRMRPDFAIAQIVGEHEDDVRQPVRRWLGREGLCGREQAGEQRQ